MTGLLSRARRGVAFLAGCALACGVAGGLAGATASTAAAAPAGDPVPPVITTIPTDLSAVPTTPPEHAVGQILFAQDLHDIAPVDQKEKGGVRGGIARLATVIDYAKKNGLPSTLVSGGDLGGGTLFGAVFRGLPMAEALKELGVSVAGYGQHDFDYGLEANKALVKALGCPWVNSNLRLASDGKRIGGTYMETIGGVKVGFLGLTTGMSTTTVVRDVIEDPIIPAAQADAAALKADGAQVIVALGQISATNGKALMEEVPDITVLLREEDSFKAPAQIIELPGGRIHAVASGNYGDVMRIYLIKNGDAVSVGADALPVNGTVADDPHYLKIQNHWMSLMDEQLATKLGCAPEAYPRPEPLGTLVANAFRHVTGAEVGWINGGGLRKDLPGGELTKKDALAVLPFGNQVMEIKATGAQLRLGLEQAANSSPKLKSGGYPLVTGIHFTYDPAAAEGSRITSLTREDGTPITDKDTLTIALTNYVYNGGNKVTAFQQAEILKEAGTAGADVDALITYINEKMKCATPNEPTTTPTEPGKPGEPAKPGEPTKPAEPAKPGLANTGVDSTALGLVSAMMVALGGLALVARRKVS